MAIERIVITGDVFRTSGGEANQLSNVRWLHAELARDLERLTGLLPEIRFRHNEPDAGRIIISRWYLLLGHTPSLEAWAATFNVTCPPSELVDELRWDYERSLVIGFEMSPLITSVLDAIGVPWINIALSPIRFLEDLALTLRFSWMVRITHPGLVYCDQIDEAVRQFRERYKHDSSPSRIDKACVFLAQTEHDRSLIWNGQFYPDSEVLQRVDQALNGRPLFLRPHPLAPANPILSALEHRFAARRIEANTYALLAGPGKVHYLSISSSAAVEAKLFGHSVDLFHGLAFFENWGCETSLWAHRSASFWRAALSPIMTVNSNADFEERTTPDRLRRIHGSWGISPPPLGGVTRQNCLSVVPG
jgi:hypothetical protein